MSCRHGELMRGMDVMTTHGHRREADPAALGQSRHANGRTTLLVVGWAA